MVRSPDPRADRGVYIVPAPRQVDAVAATLRHAFDPVADTPASLASLLARLHAIH